MRWLTALVGALFLVSLLPAAAGAATFTISGVVTNAAGAGVSGIEVYVCPLAPASGETTIMCVGSGGITATDGSYTVSNVPPNSYKVSFNDPQGDYPYGYYGPTGFTLDWAVSTTLTISTAGLTGISIQYPAVFRISGAVTGPDGLPVGNVQVNACSIGPNSGCSSGTSGRDGTYSVAVAAGSYTVQGYDNLGRYVPTYALTETGATRVVDAATSPTGVDIRFVPARHISGRIRSAINGKWQHLNIYACPTTSTQCYNAGLHEDGTFVVAVPNGTYRLSFVDFAGKILSGYWSTRGLVSTAARATVIDVTAKDFTTINAVAGPIVVGAHAGTSRTGSFSTKVVNVRRGKPVTVRFTLGKGYAGTKVTIWTAVAGSNGKLGAYRKTTTTTVRSDGYVFYTVKVKGLMAFRLQTEVTVLYDYPTPVTSLIQKAKGS